jgi:ABC-type nickel/cobalt efflux system permease component RcnA
MIQIIFLIFISLFLTAGKGEAHPMGNFSINHYSGWEISPDELRLRYILDLAEIPAFQEIQKIDLDRNGERSAQEEGRYLSEQATSLASGLMLEVAGARLALTPVSYDLTFPPGAGGLPTMRLSVLYRASLPVAAAAAQGAIDLLYRDRNFPDRTGWKEMAAVGRNGISLIGSPLPTTGSELRAYPEREIQSPPQVTETRFSFQAGSNSDGGFPLSDRKVVSGNQSLRNDRFTALMTDSAPSGAMLLLSLLISFGLGALHALSPGHGKTVVAAYLVGSRGTARHAFLLGLIVTASHTFGVFLLGLATLSLSRYIVPERLYPWLGFLSGLTILFLGFSLFLKRWRAMRDPSSDRHGHRHADRHEGRSHSHDHPHHDHRHPHEEVRTLPGLLGLGITGGIIPCPSALVVLLSAIAFHQVAFGLLLIVAFSAGLAATLVGIGLLMVYLGGMMNRLERFSTLSRVVPVFSAAAVALLGGMIAAGTWFQ